MRTLPWAVILLRRAPSGPTPAAGAELVIGELAHLRLRDLLGVLAADRAIGVAADLELGEAGAECLVEEQAADQRLADAERPA